MRWIEGGVAIVQAALALCDARAVREARAAATFVEGNDEFGDFPSLPLASARSAAVRAASGLLRQRGLPRREMRLVAWCGSQLSGIRDDRSSGRSDRESSRD
ncbi:hypothetical protein M3S04_02390 [Xanthomonas sp. PPL139]|uniref:hypothetical protein n=1 Tax=unclassified Xanthomonas TaxID=2643310 RepID=UPI0033A9C260